MGWQTIDTAPKDGTEIILYAPSNTVIDNYRTGATEDIPERTGGGLFTDGQWHWANDSCSCCWGPMKDGGHIPTHWQPLPEPPST